jgi:hypothetical protein
MGDFRAKDFRSQDFGAKDFSARDIQSIVRDREESERRAYREEAQATEAAKIVMVVSNLGGTLDCVDSAGNSLFVQNSQGSYWSPGTWITAERCGSGWQAAGIAPYSSGA